VCLLRSPQRREVAIPFDPAQARLDVEECRRQPALLLVAVLPIVDLRGALLDGR